MATIKVPFAELKISSAELLGSLTDETGSGVFVCATAPTISDATMENIILSGEGRIATGTAAGSAIEIDATTFSYAEGLELRYEMKDWADGSTTFTNAKGMYLRMENKEAIRSK
jgi:hypothetical protein